MESATALTSLALDSARVVIKSDVQPTPVPFKREKKALKPDWINNKECRLLVLYLCYILLFNNS